MTITELLIAIDELNNDLPRDVVLRGEGYQFRSDGNNYGVFVLGQFCIVNGIDDTFTYETVKGILKERVKNVVDRIVGNFLKIEEPDSGIQ